MRVTFVADTGGFFADEFALVVGVAGGGHYLTFQRDAEDPPGDQGVHVEYDVQSNGDYDCVAACRVRPAALSVDLSVDLSRQLGRLVGVTGLDVALPPDADQLGAVRAGLRRVFRGCPDTPADAAAGGRDG